jgi:hypothetical protein
VVTTQDCVRRLALALPQVTEQDHHGISSFRVGNTVFATVPDDDHVRFMVEQGQILEAVADNPGVCQPFYWGRRLACVVVHTPSAEPELIADLLRAAWTRKASKHPSQPLPGNR